MVTDTANSRLGIKVDRCMYVCERINTAVFVGIMKREGSAVHNS
jgi:hypothetical protein